MCCDNWTINSMGPSCVSRMKRRSTWRPARSSRARGPALPWFLMCRFRGRVGCAHQHCRKWWAQPALHAVWGVLALITLAASADEAQQLDEFLNRLGLTDLRLAHTERLLAREAAADKRMALARQLADAYAEELVS